MKQQTSMMQLTVAVIWLLITCSGGTTTSSTNDETTSSGYAELELQDEVSTNSAPTGTNYDPEESQTFSPPSLENDTNVNYVKNISVNEMAEVDFSTYAPPMEIETTISSVDIGPDFDSLDAGSDTLDASSDILDAGSNTLDAGSDTLDAGSDTLDADSEFSKLSDGVAANSSVTRKEANEAMTNDDVEVADESFLNSVNDSGKVSKADSLLDDAILDNVIMDRMGLAPDYMDDFKSSNDYQEKSKTSAWKPVWPFAAISGFTSTPKSVVSPKTSINNDVTTVKLVKESTNTVSKEPVTAYYFDATNTPLPAVGPLHNPKDIFGSKVYSTNINSKESEYFQNLTALIYSSGPSTKHEAHTIESTPVVSFDFVPESNKLSNNVYSILNDGFNQNEEEFSLTFSTFLPSIRESVPTKMVEILHPKLVTERSDAAVPTFKSGIKSSIMDLNTGDAAHQATTALSSLPAHVSKAPTASTPKVSNSKIVTPLWVRLSGQSSSVVNSAKTEPSLLHASNSVTTSPENMPGNITNITESTSHTSENILTTSVHTMSNVSLPDENNSPKRKAANKFNIFDSLIPQITPAPSIPIFINDTSEAFSSISNSSSVSHSSSTSMSEISISEKQKTATTPKSSDFDANFDAKTSMTPELAAASVTKTPALVPTNSAGKDSKLKSTTTSKLESNTSTTSTTSQRPDMESTISELTSSSITEENVPNISTMNVTKSTVVNASEKVETSADGLIRNPSGVSEERSNDFATTQVTTQRNPVSLDSLAATNQETFDKYHAKTDYPDTTKSPQEHIADNYEASGAQIRNKQLPRYSSTTTKEPVLLTSTLTGASVLDGDYKENIPSEMILPTINLPSSTETPERDGQNTLPSIPVDDGNMIKTVIKHLPGKKEPELKIVEMHTNGTNITHPSPYLKAAVSYGVQEFCRHQGNLRSLLGEWINSHLNNGTDSTSYEVQFFAQPNCTNMTPLPEDATKTKTVLYFYVMNNGLINPNVTRQYPKNPINLEISQKLAYLKEKILHLELVNAITSSEDLALEEAAVGTSIIAIIISTIILFFLVISAALAFVIVKRRRANDQAHGRRCTPAANDTYSMDSVSVFYHSFRRKNKKRASSKSIRSYQNQGFDDPNGPSRPLNFSKLTHFISDTEGIYEEFLKIPSVTPKYDEMPKGVEDKNRYANVIPVPETRVYLKTNVRTPIDEYINANYIHGARGEARYYIAAQAPLDETVPDFWQMIWEEEAKVIVMLTDFVEKGIDKCADYLPPSETLDCHRVYGDFQVTLKSRDMREKYIVSQVQLKNLENNLVREIAHMWFTGWPYSGIPNEEKAFISYIFETRAMRKKLRSKGPILVHCSPGTGRSGTFIACDISMRNFDDQKSVDIPKAVWKLRRERAGAVQTKEQYSFIYRVTNLYAAKLMTGNLDLF